MNEIVLQRSTQINYGANAPSGNRSMTSIAAHHIASRNDYFVINYSQLQ